MARPLLMYSLAVSVWLLHCTSRSALAEDLRYEPTKTELAGSVVTVPMEFVDRLPLVEVKINGQGPYLFILDTGASLAALNRPVAAEIGLKPHKHADVGDNSGAEGRTANVVELRSLDLGQARFAGVEAVVVDLGFVVGGNRTIDGLLGFGLFADCLLTLDYSEKTVRLERGELSSDKGRNILRYMTVHGAPRLMLRLADRTVRLTVDSGANGSLTLPRSLRKKLSFHAPPVAMGRVQRAHGDRPAQLARVVGALKIGRHRVHDPLVRLFGRSGVLGNQILQHFVVTFDQKNTRVRFVREDSAPITIPGLRSRGFYTEQRAGAPVVVEVIAGTVAAELGIRVLDRVTRVNDRPYSELSRSEWSTLWNGNDPLRLTLEGRKRTLDVTVPMVELVP